MGKGLLAISLEKFATTARADFRFAPLNVLSLVVIFVIGLVVHLAYYSFSMEAVVLALGFSAVTGVFFGIIPAFKAAVLHPIDALRHE